jgi:hypothetical protein
MPRPTLLLALIVTVAGVLAAPAHAQPLSTDAPPEMPRYRLLDERPETGSHIPRALVRDSVLPFDKPYHQLGAAQQAWLKRWYGATMGERDEPPYPRDGLVAIYRALGEGLRQLGDRGELWLNLEIDAKGQLSSVAVVKAASPEFGRYLAWRLLELPFKPAQCNGQPCAGVFPVQLELARKP